MFNRINAARNAAVKNVVTRIADAAEKKLDRIAEKDYDAQIAASQAKIGEYKPASIPVQVWA